MRYILYAAIVAAILTAGCNDASAIKDGFESVNDKMEIHATMVMDWIRALPHEEAQEDEIVGYEEYPEPVFYGYESDGFMQEGVRDYNGRTETWYSSNQAYHYRTSEWSVDDEGYYRDSEGYYVVAASDVPEGAVIDGTKGECKVYDSGCDDGVTDYYVAW